MVRRSLLILLALAAVTAGCSTFSDSDVVARVNDVELTNDDLDARLTELGVNDTDVVLLDPVRAELTGWIQQQLVPDEAIAAIYNAGAAEAGLVCVGAIVVADQESADSSLADIDSGTDFAEVFQRENLDPSLTDAGGAIDCLDATAMAENAGTPFVDLAATLSPDNATGVAPILDATGAEVAWVVLEFRAWDELDDNQRQQTAGLVDIAEYAADADVYVASRYGTFDVATGTVVSLG